MATKYKVTGPLVLLPYYPDPSTGAPLPASKNVEDNAMKDEYGRTKVGYLKLTTGKEFYTGDNAPDDKFHTFDQRVVEKYLSYNVVEEAEADSSIQAQEEQKEEKPATKKASKSSSNEE